MSLAYSFFMEIWKDIKDYENLYQVSNLGNVKSLPKSWVGGNGAIRTKGETILKQYKDTNGYLQVKLCKNGAKIQWLVHRLVWQTFNHITDLQIDHIVEGNKLDNRLSNLQPVNNRQNISKHYLSTNKSSKYTGVSWNKSRCKWQAKIKIGKKSKNLGLFISEIQAAIAYQIALKMLP